METFVLLVACPDQPGIVARLTGVLYSAGCNILALEQHVEEGELFVMRIEASLLVGAAPVPELRRRLAALATQLDANVSLRERGRRRRVGVLVSREGSCLQELLTKRLDGELQCEIPIVIGNHDDLRPVAAAAGVAFEHVPAAPGVGGDHETRMLELLARHEVELVVLARYMRILSPDFVAAHRERIINIHHGFLPAFKGARPYHQAWERGVKIIGATAHFVTDDLDEGPIIAQAVAPVSHQHTVAAMTETGRDIEKRVLADAVKAYLDDRIIVLGARTIVFHP